MTVDAYRPPQVCIRWTPNEDYTIRELRPTHKPAEIAAIIGRTHKAVNHRAHLLSLSPAVRYPQWSDTVLERAKFLWRSGHSASEVSKILDCGLSKNAVIGKLWRMGLSSDRPPREPKPKDQRVRRSRGGDRTTNRGYRSKKVPAWATLKTEGFGFSLPPSLPPLLPSLRENDGCMWIDDIGYCGHPKAEGHQSYCAHHWRVSVR